MADQKHTLTSLQAALAEGRLLTKPEAGEILRQCERSVDLMIARGELAVIRFGRSVRIHPDDLAALIESRRGKAAKA